jgi:hypothetical protein
MGGTNSPGCGALVVSLDFELLWGVRDLYPADGGTYRQHLLGERTVVAPLLDLFEEFEVAATWATVGMMFAASREELERYRPAFLPRYDDARLNPYDDALGAGENDDPLRYAASLVEQIARRPRQEMASHTYSHFYCLEPGSDVASFRSDLDSAVAIARDRGMEMRSLVFPRNQFNPDYVQALIDTGFTSCRINPSGLMHRMSARSKTQRPYARAGRMLDTYVEISGDRVTPWQDIPFIGSLCCLPSSQFLRPYTPRLRHLEPLRLRRITSGLRKAAEQGGVFHLWWHPHNFGTHTEENLAFLRRILEEYRLCRDRFELRSLTMAEAAEVASSMRLELAA